MGGDDFEGRGMEGGGPQATEWGLFVAQSAASRRLLDEVRYAARTRHPALLVGPTGAGKTSLAAVLHGCSPRRAGPFVARSIPSIPDELRQVELYGAERGAYTGSVSSRIGVLEAAHGGTLFLDELGHASRGMQQVLLTAVESGTVQRLGERTHRPVDVRFVFASSVDLWRLAAEGRMLAELIHRVDVHRIEVPALRERPEDIEPLARHFLLRYGAEQGVDASAWFSAPLIEMLRAYHWPGNVRELQSVCCRLAIRARPGQELTPADLVAAGVGERNETPSLAEADRMRAAVDRCGGNKSRAARELRVSRTTLYRMLRAEEGERRDAF